MLKPLVNSTSMNSNITQYLPHSVSRKIITLIQHTALFGTKNSYSRSNKNFTYKSPTQVRWDNHLLPNCSQTEYYNLSIFKWVALKKVNMLKILYQHPLISATKIHINFRTPYYASINIGYKIPHLGGLDIIDLFKCTSYLVSY